MDIDQITKTLWALAADFGVKVLAAFALWVVGRMLIGFVVGLVGKAITRQKLDATVNGYICSAIAALLNIALVMAMLGYFGVQTTTFTALIASAGLAVGMAWSGLLANFAAGAFLVILRPFKQGDFVTAGGVTGTIEEIGLFATTIQTPDNVRAIVGNNKIFADTIHNFTANPYRRVELTAQLAAGVDALAAADAIAKAVAAIPNVKAAPAPDVTILTFTERGPVLAVRPYCHNDHYWQVYFDTNAAILRTCTEKGYPSPELPVGVRQRA